MIAPVDFEQASEVISIIKSYGLSQNLETRLISIGIRRINELHLNSFEDRYTYLSHLVEKFTSSFITRLGESVNDIPDRKKPQARPKKNLITAREALDYVKDHLDKTDYFLFCQLVENPENRLNISRNQLVERIPTIQRRLESLAKRYEREGQLVIPKRPIVHVKFDPLFIKFGRRNFNGDPLSFFRKHKKTYGRLSRTELAGFDRGLYRSLLKQGQLEQAIPETRHRNFNGDPLSFFRENSKYSGLSRTELARIDPTLYGSLISYNQLGQAIPETKPHSGKRLSESEVREIIEARDTYKGDASKASRHLGRDRRTVIKYWRRAKLIPHKAS
jgi:hypothetical protein